MQKFHHGQPSWNFPTVRTNQTDIFIPRKGVENSHVIYKQSLPGTKMIDCARGFKLRSAISVYKFVLCSYFLYFNNSKKKLHQKETLPQVFSCEFCKILQTFSSNTSWPLLLKLLLKTGEETQSRMENSI